MVRREVQSLALSLLAFSLLAQTPVSANPTTGQATNQRHGTAAMPLPSGDKQVLSGSSKAADSGSPNAAMPESVTGIDNAERKDKFGFPILTKSDSDAISQQSADIHGIHPIKRALQPIVNMQAVIVKLQLQIMQLCKPISDLQPPMAALDKKATGVDSGLVATLGQMNTMQNSIDGIRSDLVKVEKKINRLVAPVERLNKPIVAASKPLMRIDQQLSLILFAILGSVLLICIGVPVMAMLLFFYRHKIFSRAGA